MLCILLGGLLINSNLKAVSGRVKIPCTIRSRLKSRYSSRILIAEGDISSLSFAAGFCIFMSLCEVAKVYMLEDLCYIFIPVFPSSLSAVGAWARVKGRS